MKMAGDPFGALATVAGVAHTDEIPRYMTHDRREEPYLDKGIEYVTGTKSLDAMMQRVKKHGWNFLSDPDTGFLVALLNERGLSALNGNKTNGDAPQLSSINVLAEYDSQLALNNLLHVMNEPVSDTKLGELPPLMGLYPYAVLEGTQPYGILVIGPESATETTRRTVTTDLYGTKKREGDIDIGSHLYGMFRNPLEERFLSEAAKSFKDGGELPEGVTALSISYDVVKFPMAVTRIDGGVPIASQIQGSRANELLITMTPKGNRMLGVYLDDIIVKGAQDPTALPSPDGGDSLVGTLTYEALSERESKGVHLGNKWTGLVEVVVVSGETYANPEVHGLTEKLESGGEVVGVLEEPDSNIYLSGPKTFGGGFRGGGATKGMFPDISRPKVGRTKATDVRSVDVNVSGVLTRGPESAFRFLLTNP